MAPSYSSFLAHISSFVSYKPTVESPHTKPTSAIILSIVFTCVYVGVLYLHPLTRPSPRQSRDAPSVIRLRIRAVYTSCLITTASTLYALRLLAGMDFWTTLKYMGIWPIGVVDIVKGMGLTMVLFAGPLVELFWLDREPEQTIAVMFEDASISLQSWIGWRNFVVSPITEELTFRSHIIALHLSTPKPSVVSLVFLTPLYFGIAHLHHFYEFTLTHPDSTWTFALLRSFIQFAYTTLFGWYAAWIYLRLGSLWTAILVHSFCNSLGLPRFYGRLPGEVWKTYVYYVVLVAGAVGFYMGLFRWTESSNALIKM